MRSERLTGLVTVLAIAVAAVGCVPAAAQPPPVPPIPDASGRLTGTASTPASPAIPPADGARPATAPTPSARTASAGPVRPRPSPTTRPVPATPSPPTASGAVRWRLGTALERDRARLRIPGISVSILFPDGTAWTGTSGLADVEAAEPVTAETAFAIASMTKTFVAALILDLSSRGVVGLDDPVARHLPDLDVDPAITVRMLLDHTSGLHDYFMDPRIDRALQGDRAATWTPARALRYAGDPYFDPGTGWHYSNTNYLLLGLLAERVGGAALASQLRDRFLDPLALESTFYQPSEPARGPVARGYRMTGSGKATRVIDLSDGTGIAPFRSVVTASAGAGGLAASSLDVAAWARALYGGEALDAESLSLMLSGVQHVAGYRPRVPYGLGVQAIAVDGRPTFGHSGRFLGFRGVMRWLPEEQVAIAVLTNQSRIDPAPIAARLLRIALPAPAPPRAPRRS